MDKDSQADDPEHDEFELPVDLETQRAEIERLASEMRRIADNPDRDAVRALAVQLRPAVEFARVAALGLAEARATADAASAALRQALAEANIRLPPLIEDAGQMRMPGLGTMGSGRVVTGSATLAAASALHATAEVVQVSLGDTAAATESLTVTKSGRSLLERLTADRVFYITLTWMITVGIAVGTSKFHFSGQVEDNIQNDQWLVDSALWLTLIFLNRH